MFLFQSFESLYLWLKIGLELFQFIEELLECHSWLLLLLATIWVRLLINDLSLICMVTFLPMLSTFLWRHSPVTDGVCKHSSWLWGCIMSGAFLKIRDKWNIVGSHPLGVRLDWICRWAVVVHLRPSLWIWCHGLICALLAYLMTMQNFCSLSYSMACLTIFNASA